ncbi:HhH-GPD base excision DNA repair protein [Gracilaria domingensis]|nr:HhH-GPD base excision DNA repair protein [Gracilaria domingensis]
MPTRRRQPPSRYSPPPAYRQPKRQRVATTAQSQVRRSSAQVTAVPVSNCAANAANAAACKNDSSISFSDTQVQRLRQSLLDWYVDNYRTLPWRAPPAHRKHGRAPLPRRQAETQACAGAPYAVWISEMMSQQTRISVVVQYYERWMKRFPTVDDLADACLEEVYQLWAGLGYYRRAKFVHEAAKQIVRLHDGVIPQHVHELRELSGIGMYTAGAISSIAYGHAVPLVDGNVQRVFSRLRTDITKCVTNHSEQSREYWRLASTCVSDMENAGDLNQALMEVGATVCKPKGALCEACPISSMCDAFKEARERGEKPSEYVSRYPLKRKRKGTKVRSETVLALVVCDVNERTGSKSVLMRVRQGDGLLSGLLETPNVVLSHDGDEAVRRAAETLVSELRDSEQIAGANARCDALLDGGRVKHVFSHIVQSIVIKVLVVRGAAARGRWVEATALGESAVSTQMKKVVAAALSKV